MTKRFSLTLFQNMMNRVRRVVAPLAMVVLLAACGAGPGAQQQGLPSGSTVTVSAASQTVSVEVSNAPLTAVLSEVGRQAGITATVPDVFKYDLISLSFQNLPLEDALKRIVGARAYAFDFGQHEGREVIVGVRLVAKSDSAPASTGVPGVPPAAAAATQTMQLMAQVMKTHGVPNSSLPSGAWGHGDPVVKAASEESFDRELPFEDLQRSFSEAQDPAVRSEMLDVLASRAEEEGKPAWPLLSNALADRDGEVREAALNLMKASSDPVPIGPLAMMAMSEKNADLRMEAMTLMTDQLSLDGRTREEWTAVQTSLTRSLSDSNPDIREQAEALLSSLAPTNQPVTKRGFH